jgi:hypothetical protein
MKRDAKVSLFLVTLYCLAHGPTPVPSALARPLARPAGPAPQGCTHWMTPGYSTYTSVTASTDATKIYTQVTVSGTTTGTCPPGCLSQCNALHAGSAYNYVGGVGGWYNGHSVSWNSWLDVVNNQTINATPGTEYTFSSSTHVDCSVAGLIYQLINLDEYLSIYVTTVQTVNDNGAGLCKTTPDCTPGKTPKCGVPQVRDGVPCAPGFYCMGLATRFSESDPWFCWPYALCPHTSMLPGDCK